MTASQSPAAVREYVRVYFRATDPARNACQIEWESVAETQGQAIDQSRRWAEASGFRNVHWYLVDRFYPQSIQNFRTMAYNPTGGHRGQGAWEMVKTAQ